MAYLYLFLINLILFVNTIAAQATSTGASSFPTATSSPTIVQQAFAYTPSQIAAGIFTGVYAIAAFIICVRLFSNRTWWGLCLPIGAIVMTAGFALRVVLLIYPNSEAIYICSLLFILLSPTTFLAFNYILYGRFVITCIERRHSLIRPDRTATYFVISDVTTFLVQGAGGALLSSTNATTFKVGIYVIIAGLALQALSFGIFILFVCYVYWSLKRDGLKPFDAPWSIILKMLFFTSSLFMLRCIYRTIEFALGLGRGYLADHEVFFYVLDSLPLFLGISTYAIFWPSRYLSPYVEPPKDEMRNMIEADSPPEWTPSNDFEGRSGIP